MFVYPESLLSTTFSGQQCNLSAKVMLHTAKERHQKQLDFSIKITIVVTCDHSMTMRRINRLYR